MAYTGSHSYNEHKRYNINQAQPGTTPIVTRVPYPAFQSAILYSSDGGWAAFNGVTFRLDKRYSDGLFFLGSYQLSRSRDNGSGEIEANDTAYAWDLNADTGLRAVRSASPGPGELRLRVAVRARQAVAVQRRRRGLRVWWMADPGNHAVRVRIPVQRLLHERLPVRIVRPAAREPRRRRATSESSTTPTVDRWFDKSAYAVPALGTQGTAGRNTVRGPGTQQINMSLSKRFPINRARVEFRAEIFNLLNHNNFGNPDANISNATVGTITTADDGRAAQFGLRLAW